MNGRDFLMSMKAAEDVDFSARATPVEADTSFSTTHEFWVSSFDFEAVDLSFELLRSFELEDFLYFYCFNSSNESKIFERFYN